MNLTKGQQYTFKTESEGIFKATYYGQFNHEELGGVIVLQAEGQKLRDVFCINEIEIVEA